MSRTSRRDNVISRTNKQQSGKRAESIEQLRDISRKSGQSQLSTTRNKTQRNDAAGSNAQQNKENSKRNANTRQSNLSQGRVVDQDGSVSNRSPAPISRTPSADRRLLRNLTITPDSDDVVPTQPNENESPFRHPSPNKPQPANKSRQSLKAPVHKSPSYVESPAKESVKSRAQGNQDLKILNLPSEPRSEKKEDWQAGKSVPEANSYMLKYEVVADVTFTVGDEREDIRAHKYMLMSRSSVLFKSLIKHLGNPDVRVQVPDIKPSTFRDMLQYIYTDEFDIHTDNVASMLHAAKKFQLKGLIDICFKYLDAEIQDETVPKILELAHIYNESTLYEKCLRYIYSHAENVLRNTSMSEMCAECLGKVLKADELTAGEEAVFDGALIWADAECRRRKVPVTDESRRQVLGKLLYLIRFPVMDVTYFTQKVSLGNLLSHDETLSIFQYFHGEEQQLPNRFSRTERNGMPKIPRDIEQNRDRGDSPQLPPDFSPNMSRVRRFPITDGQWKQNGPPDAISFTVNYPIILYGVELFGCSKGRDTYELTIMVFGDTCRKEIRKNEACMYNTQTKLYNVVKLLRPLRIPARRVHTILIQMKGSPTFKGVDGEAIQVVDGVTFEFIASNRSSNGTDVTVGQIPGILFTRTTSC